MKRIVLAATLLAAILGAGACGASSSNPVDPSARSHPPSAAATSETPVQWIEVFRASVSQNDAVSRVETKPFSLSGTARLGYLVTGTSNRPDFQGRAADILFQDVALDHESSRVDTTIEVDRPGEGAYDLGSRNGRYFLILNARGGTVQADEPGGVPKSGWSDVTVTVIVEQRK
jgi:hypothetical protein